MKQSVKRWYLINFIIWFLIPHYCRTERFLDTFLHFEGEKSPIKTPHLSTTFFITVLRRQSCILIAHLTSQFVGFFYTNYCSFRNSVQQICKKCCGKLEEPTKQIAVYLDQAEQQRQRCIKAIMMKTQTCSARSARFLIFFDYTQQCGHCRFTTKHIF